MNKLFASVVVCCSAVALANSHNMDRDPGTAPTGGTMTWTPPKVSKPDKKGIDDFYKAMEAAHEKRDVEAMAAMVDFPAFMITDDSKGNGMGEAWNRETWVRVMTDSMKNMPSDMKITHKHTPTFLSDNLAVVVEDHSGTMNKKSVSWKSSCVMYKKDGKWMVKEMAEGGWGDMMQAPHAAVMPTNNEKKPMMK